MPTPLNTLLIEGSFAELAEELAHYIDEIRKRQGDEARKTWPDIEPLIQANSTDEALKKLVTASVTLNAAPEKGRSRPLLFSMPS